MCYIKAEKLGLNQLTDLLYKVMVKNCLKYANKFSHRQKMLERLLLIVSLKTGSTRQWNMFRMFVSTAKGQGVLLGGQTEAVEYYEL